MAQESAGVAEAAPVRHETPTRPQRRDLGEAAAILEGWLRRTLGRSDLAVRSVRMPGESGVANETLLVDAALGGGDGAVATGYVVRMDSPDEHLFLGMDIAAHYRTYQAMAGVPGVAVPRMLGFEADTSLLGDRFFLMERVAGRVPPDRPNFHLAGWVSELPAERRRTMWRNAIETMARMHGADVARFAFLDRPHLGGSGLAQEFAHWRNYARWSGADRQPAIARAAEWLAGHFPDDPPTGFSWGDARLQNIIFDDRDGIAAVLDWDMVSLAGPETDLAWFAITDQNHTTSKGLARLEGFGTPAEAIALWEECAGRKVRDMEWFVMFNCYRTGAIMIRLATMLRRAGLLQPEAEYLLTNNSGIQWLTTRLGLPPAGPITTPWVPLDC